MDEPVVGVTRDSFFEGMLEAMSEGQAAVFAGAGVSRSAGYVDWKGLLQEFADELGLDLEVEHDLVSVAQYHLNREKQNRARLHAKLVEEFSSGTASSGLHLALAQLSVDLYWTTNYDDLIETSLRAVGRSPLVRHTASDLGPRTAEHDCDVFKLHGDLSDPNTITITRDDYEQYRREHPMFRERLQADLVSRRFLFVGFSFADPHLDFVLGEIRSALGGQVPSHYAVIRREPATIADGGANYAATRQRLRIEDLERYGVCTLLVDDYDEIPPLLEELQRRYLRSHVFVSGAAHQFEPLGMDELSSLAASLGASLIDAGYSIVSGFGLGVGPVVLSGALERLYSDPHPRIDRRLVLRPFPHQKPDPELYTKYRESMIRMAGSAVFMAGNRAGSGGTELSPGVREEYDLCRAMGVYPIPIGMTGWVAADLWNDVDAAFDEVFPAGTPRELWRVLNDVDADLGDVVTAVLGLLDHLRPRAMIDPSDSGGSSNG